MRKLTNSKKQTSSSNNSKQTMPGSREFPVPQPTAQNSQQSDLNAHLRKKEDFGHNPSQIQPSKASDTLPVKGKSSRKLPFSPFSPSTDIKSGSTRELYTGAVHGKIGQQTQGDRDTWGENTVTPANVAIGKASDLQMPSVINEPADPKKENETAQETQRDNASPVIHKTPERRKSWHGDERDRTTQNPEFQKSLGIMREALNIDPAHRNDSKIGFPFSFFDHAFGTTPKEEKMIVKGGKEKTGTIQMPNHTTDVERIVPMLPTSLSQGGHLEHQLRQGDAAKNSSPSSLQNKVTMERVREAAVGVKYAKDTGLSLDQLHQPSPEIDFQSKTPSGKKVKFDPFTSPQSKKPTNKQMLGKHLVEKGDLQEKDLPGSSKQKPVTPKDQKGMDENWVKDAFAKHTNQSKGEGVTGHWDQTSDTQERVEELNKHISNNSSSSRHLQNVDLKLDEEYVKEDMLVRSDLAKRRRRKSI